MTASTSNSTHAPASAAAGGAGASGSTGGVDLHVEGGIAFVTISRPGKLNSLTIPMLEELAATAKKIRRDRSIRAVILAGEDHNFTAGLDFGSALKKPRGRLSTLP